MSDEAKDSGNGERAMFMGGVPAIAPYGLALQKEQSWHKMAAILALTYVGDEKLGKTPAKTSS